MVNNEQYEARRRQRGVTPGNQIQCEVFLVSLPEPAFPLMP